MGHRWNDTQGKSEVMGENYVQVPLFFTINPTRLALESNPDRHSETPETKGGDVR